jgi:hypothetical protein
MFPGWTPKAITAWDGPVEPPPPEPGPEAPTPPQPQKANKTKTQETLSNLKTAFDRIMAHSPTLVLAVMYIQQLRLRHLQFWE